MRFWLKAALQKLADLARPLARMSFAAVLAFVALVWLATIHTIQTERDALINENQRDADNLALLVEQNVILTANDLDSILKSLRRSYEKAEGHVDWAKMVTDDFTVDGSTVQIAVIDAHGMMITSSAMPHPDKLVDLSDREHYQAQRDSQSDKLFISKPVLGRASNKWSVQFTRRLVDSAGAFAGVIVASLDPVYLARAYAGLKLANGVGIALVGEDRIVRASMGNFEKDIGNKLDQALFDRRGQTSQENGATAIRSVAGYPLQVIATVEKIENDEKWRSGRMKYLVAAFAFSCMVLLIAGGAAYQSHRQEKRVLHLARHDSLTSLSNRVQFQEKLDAVFALPPAMRRYALHFVDLDGFKLVNDTHGHHAGDLLLAAVATRLQGTLREGDLLARLGGDEFAIVQSVGDFWRDASALGERICAVVSEPYEILGRHILVGTSVGIASAVNDANDSGELVKAADMALYSAKASGRGVFKFFNEGLRVAIRKRAETESGMRTALARGDFVAFYQPIVDVTTREVVGYEALLRWRHPVKGLIPPGEFIAIAEETNLIVAIGDWMLHKACEEIARLPGRPRVAVNCSPVQFRRGDLVQSVESALRKSGISPSQLEIEITESILIKDDANINAQLQALHEAGVSIALDDFGTGFSCLSYLEQYPIDRLKIDRSFTSRLTESAKTRAVVKAIIELASGLGMKTVGEGVETPSQLEMLKTLGCVEAQGYFFSQPQPAEKIFPSPEAATKPVPSIAA